MTNILGPNDKPNIFVEAFVQTKVSNIEMGCLPPYILGYSLRTLKIALTWNVRVPFIKIS